MPPLIQSSLRWFASFLSIIACVWLAFSGWSVYICRLDFGQGFGWALLLMVFATIEVPFAAAIALVLVIVAATVIAKKLAAPQATKRVALAFVCAGGGLFTLGFAFSLLMTHPGRCGIGF